MRLERWADRRGARFAAAHGIYSRADVILPAQIRHAQTDLGIGTGVPDSGRLAIEPKAVTTGGTHIRVTGLPDEGQAMAIHKAISGNVSDAITEGE